MTIASSNGSSRLQSPLIPDLSQAISTRPDRNTHNGKQPDLHQPPEESIEQMKAAVRTMLLSLIHI